MKPKLSILNFVWNACSSDVTSILMGFWYEQVVTPCWWWLSNLKRNVTAKERNLRTTSSCDLLCCFRNFPFSFYTCLCIGSYLLSSPCTPAKPQTGLKIYPSISHCIHFTFPQYFVIKKPFTSKHRLIFEVKLSFLFSCPEHRVKPLQTIGIEFPLYAY